MREKKVLKTRNLFVQISLEALRKVSAVLPKIVLLPQVWLVPAKSWLAPVLDFSVESTSDYSAETNREARSESENELIIGKWS